MPKAISKLIFALLFIWISGCSLALDVDALSEGDDDDSDTGTGTDDDSCVSNADCDDSVECTIDVCGDDGSCVNTADDTLCEYLEVCDAVSGCIDSGYDCIDAIDCDDGIDCTVEMCFNNNCYNEPDDSLCVNEENLCIVNQECISDVGCSPGELVECDQTGLGPCEESVCNPETGLCEEGIAAGADDDEDGYSDMECGGDDCNDSDPEINAGATEVCNLIDEDCDGVTDAALSAGPVEVVSGTSLQGADVAFDGDRFAVVWQTTNEVYVQVLGTGDCIVDTVCIEGDGEPAFDEVNLTSKGGVNSVGTDPSITTDGETFFVAWTATPDGQSPRVIMVEVDYNTETTDTAVSDAEQLSNGDAKAIVAPQIEWQENLGWAAAWARVFSDDTVAVEVINEGASAPFTGQQVTGEVESLSLAPLDSDECVVAYGFRESSSADLEVWEADLVWGGSAWSYNTGWPKMISSSSDTLEDPSRQPSVTRTGAAAWVTAFTDVAVPTDATEPEAEADIRGVDSSSGTEIADIIKDNAFDQLSPKLVYNGVGFGVLYTQDVGSGNATLDFRMLDSSLQKLTDQGARFAHLEPGELSSTALIKAGDGFAAVWIEGQSSLDTIKLAAFEGCEPSP